jgi:hypothetical protein
MKKLHSIWSLPSSNDSLKKQSVKYIPASPEHPSQIKRINTEYYDQQLAKEIREAGHEIKRHKKTAGSFVDIDPLQYCKELLTLSLTYINLLLKETHRNNHALGKMYEKIGYYYIQCESIDTNLTDTQRIDHLKNAKICFFNALKLRKQTKKQSIDMNDSNTYNLLHNLNACKLKINEIEKNRLSQSMHQIQPTM